METTKLVKINWIMAFLYMPFAMMVRGISIFPYLWLLYFLIGLGLTRHINHQIANKNEQGVVHGETLVLVLYVIQAFILAFVVLLLMGNPAF